MSQTPQWPCSKISISELLRLSNSNAFVIMEIEQKLCNKVIFNELINWEVFQKWMRVVS